MRKAEYILFITWMLVNFDVSSQTIYHEAIAQGLRLQIKADSMQRQVEALTLSLSTALESRKNGIRMAIRDYDAMAVVLQMEANKWFAQAITLEKGQLPVISTYTSLSSEIVDSVAMAEAAFIKPETNILRESEFAILYQSPYSAANPVPIDKALPDGVVYKIQLGAFSKPPSANTFKGLTPISGETAANGLIRYYVGMFSQFAAADDALRKVRNYGFKDAFIVAFYNQKTINPERARQLEGGR